MTRVSLGLEEDLGDISGAEMLLLIARVFLHHITVAKRKPDIQVFAAKQQLHRRGFVSDHLLPTLDAISLASR